MMKKDHYPNKRNKTRRISIGNISIGDGAPITVQSMTNTKTYDVKSTVRQITLLEDAGCEIACCCAGYGKRNSYIRDKEKDKDTYCS